MKRTRRENSFWSARFLHESRSQLFIRTFITGREKGRKIDAD